MRRLIPFVLFLLLLSPTIAAAQALSSADRAALEAQLAQVQAEQAQAQQALVAAQSKSSSLQNTITVLAAKIKTEQLAIQAKNLTIQTLGANITSTQGQIDTLTAQITQNEAYIGDLFSKMRQADDVSLMVVFLSNISLSQFYDDEASLQVLQQDISTLSAQLTSAKASSTVQKNTLVTAQNAALDARYAIQQLQQTMQSNTAQQKKLLGISKSTESAYSTLIATNKKEIAAINAKLFALAGGSNPIPFGTAYQYALAAQQKTGLDPAFLLAIMTQESNLGSNQGNCYLSNQSTGAGVSVKTGKVFAKTMQPTRDVPPFLTITSALGVDPMHTVVSCPQSVGWGGAMGPAQFIPSTWMLFTNRVSSALGTSGMANPWDPQAGFMASALYLSDLGANGGGFTAEKNAACKYYSGSSCSASSLIASYGTSVMSLASTIQTTEIDKLQAIQ
jgi:membrane-bound lytic murein transglycosylase B